MPKKEHTNSKNGQHKARKPEPACKGKRITFFDSVEDMNADELKWLASLLPEEHLQHATSLIKRVFSEQLKKHPRIGKHITFG